MRSILYVDDNPDICQALKQYFCVRGRYHWLGELDRADGLTEAVVACRPDVLVVDIDMPGRDVFVALKEALFEHPVMRPLVFTGHARRDLVERAIEAGAWAYICKTDGEDALFDAIDRVMQDDLVLSPEARAVFESVEPGQSRL